MNKPFSIAGVNVERNSRVTVDIDVARLYDFTEMSMPVEVIRGKEDGPVLFICAAIHGDEINGVEIIKRVLMHRSLKRIKGTLIAVPIVNIFGFNTKSRYLPDRRDLNRCFPGIRDGSLASQLAHSFMDEVVSKATHGIDLHTGAIHRSNLPQIRGCLDDDETLRLAEAFNVPVIIHSALRDGSLRDAARAYNIPMLLYEGGEALRFNEHVIKTGVRGVLSVMRSIGMLPHGTTARKKVQTYVARSSHWLRASHSGMMVPTIKIGDRVKQGQLLGVISDPFGKHHFEIKARQTGIVIGFTQLPLVNEGDAVFHVATFEDSAAVQESMEHYQDAVIGQQDTFVT